MPDEVSKELGDLKIKVGVLEAKQGATDDRLKSCVTQDQFAPVKVIVYGIAGTILSSVLLALLAKVIMK